jgi:hypothetical protein
VEAIADAILLKFLNLLNRSMFAIQVRSRIEIALVSLKSVTRDAEMMEVFGRTK